MFSSLCIFPAFNREAGLFFLALPAVAAAVMQQFLDQTELVWVSGEPTCIRPGWETISGGAMWHCILLGPVEVDGWV